MNKYHSFYFSELETKIREVALESMRAPILNDDKENYNLKTVMYNHGIKCMAEDLIDALKKEAEETDAV